jgi:MSHA biogenesis protein MshP
MKRRQRGFSAALVLVVLVLLGGMLAYGVTLTSGMHSSIAQEIAQERARQAADAGLEWARYNAHFTGLPNDCVAVSALTMPFSSGPMPVTVRCTFDGVHSGLRTYSLSANACLPAGPGGICPNAAGGADYVERKTVGNAER